MLAHSAYRRTVILAAALVVLSGSSFLGCCRANSGKAADDLVLTESDAGKTFHLGAGQSVAITVSSNGSIGYSWSFGKIVGDSLVSAGEVTPDNGSRAPGNSESTTYRFRAVKAGQATILMNYTSRTGSTFSTQTRTFTIIVDAPRTTAPLSAVGSHGTVELLQ